MRIVSMNIKKEQKYATIFEISNSKDLIVISNGTLTYRDIRIIQLCLMIGYNETKREVGYIDLKRKLNFLTLLSNEELGHIIKSFKILDFEAREYISKLDSISIKILKANTSQLLKPFIIEK